MMLTLLLLIATTLPQQPTDESAAVAAIKQALTKATGANEATQKGILNKLRQDIFGMEVSVNSAAIAAFGDTKITHPAWLAWGLNDLRTEVNDSNVESDYQKLGFAFTGEQTEGGALRMLKNQREVVFQKEYGDLYVSYVVLFSTKDIAKLKSGAKLTFTFRLSAIRASSAGIEMRGVVASIKSDVKKSK
jgi:hypothetical protein